MSYNAQGDITRYWSVNGIPVVETIVLQYAPHDPRAADIPDDLHALYAPQLADMGSVVDGDDNQIAAEPVVNRWLISSRSVTHAPLGAVGDLIFAVSDLAEPQNFFRMAPLPGVQQVTVEAFNQIVVDRESKRQTDLQQAVEEAYATNLALRKSIGEPLALALWGPPISVEMLMKGPGVFPR